MRNNRSYLWVMIMFGGLTAICASAQGTQQQTQELATKYPDLSPGQIDHIARFIQHVQVPLDLPARFDVPPEMPCPETYASLGFHKDSLNLVLPASALEPAAFRRFEIAPKELTSGWMLFSPTCEVTIEISVSVLKSGKWTTVPVFHRNLLGDKE